MKRRSRISQADIAHQAGVSQPVVSAALSDSPAIAVSESTRKKIVAAAEALGYPLRKNSPKRITRNQGYPILWLSAVPDYNNKPDNEVSQAEIAYALRNQQILNRVVQTLDKWKQTLIVKHVANEQDCIQWLKKNKVSGILWHMGGRHQNLLKTVLANYPVVSMNRAVHKAMDCVVTNQEEVTQLAINHLMEKGHRRIAYFGHIPYDELLMLRKRHYEALMKANNLRVYTEFFDIPDRKEETSAVKVSRILDCWQSLLADKRPTALFISDIHAINLLNQASDRKIKIPDDLSVIGVDNIPYDEISRPRLTSIRYPLDEQTENAVELLMSRIENPERPPRMVMFNPELVERDSVASLTR